MARTKASVGSKVSSVKSTKARCSVAPPQNYSSSSGTDRGRSTGGGGNPVCPRETPKWQKSITTFFNQPREKNTDDGDHRVTAGSSKTKPKRNIIESDEESSPVKEIKDKEVDLDGSMILGELTGENSHKIEEYFEKEGRTEDKAPRGKENVNNEEDNVRKREREDEEEGNSSKKIKVN